MSNTVPPISHQETFNQKIFGFFGKMGTGANAQISFVQGGIKPIELDRITLIGDIPNSERWPVRDLFQRDVDNDRVTNGLLPYFKDDNKVKFFNPLTLTLLPVDRTTHQIVTKIPVFKEYEETDANKTVWNCYEADGVYRFKHVKNNEQYGVIEWNDALVKVVAIDGQHRLSALKRYKNDTNGDSKFNDWTIPIVLFGLNSLDKQDERQDNVLNYIRNIFIYINTQAKPPNKTRQILLSDERINDICVQELLDYYHGNDLLEGNEKDFSKMPLLFFDWRGEEKNGVEQSTPGAIKSIVEIRDWFEEYILGENYSDEQKIALGVQPTTKILHAAFTQKQMGPSEAREIKRVFREDLMPGLCYFLENFIPYNDYIKKIRDIEQYYQNQTDIARHAFYQLRFGSNRASSALKKEVDSLFTEILTVITAYTQSDDFVSKVELLDREIGMRGIVFAYGELSQMFSNWTSSKLDWLEYSKWFTKQVNLILEDGWLSKKDIEKKELLLHIVRDQNDIIVNYRFQDVPNALGAYVLILIVSYAFSSEDQSLFSKQEWVDIWQRYTDLLSNSLLKGYKKQARTILKEKYPNDPQKLKEAVNAEAEQRTEDHIDVLMDKIKMINKHI